MCEIFNFTCPGCKYSAHSIVKQESGFWHGIEWAPMLCADCSELCGPVILGEHFEGKYKELKAHQVCEHCRSSNLNLWSNMECPKCHDGMIKGEHIGYTDG
jgi:hypothetical protein